MGIKSKLSLISVSAVLTWIAFTSTGSGAKTQLNQYAGSVDWRSLVITLIVAIGFAIWYHKPNRNKIQK